MEKSLNTARDKLGEGRKSISRRKFLGLVGGAAALVGSAIACKAGGEGMKDKECKFGKLIDNDIHILVTDPAGGGMPPILRKELSLDDSDEHWYVRSGVMVKTQKVTGPLYPTGQSKLEHEGCGVWFLTETPLEVFKPNEQSILVSQVDENGQVRKEIGYIAGSFLRQPTEEELEKLKASS